MRGALRKRQPLTLQQVIDKGNGIAYGEPDHLDRQNMICDKYGRRLETVKACNTRRQRETKVVKGILSYPHNANQDILDPVTLDVIMKAGERFTFASLLSLHEAGHEIRAIARKCAVKAY